MSHRKYMSDFTSFNTDVGTKLFIKMMNKISNF